MCEINTGKKIKPFLTTFSKKIQKKITNRELQQQQKIDKFSLIVLTESTTYLALVKMRRVPG